MTKTTKKVSSHTLAKTIKPLLLSGQPVRFKVKGTSMHPFLKDQQTTVTIAPVTEQLKKHQILLYETTTNHLILHRLIKTNDPLILRGDALTTIEHVPKKRVLGVVTGIETNAKTIPINTKTYRFKVWLWVHLKPVRKLLLKILR